MKNTLWITVACVFFVMDILLIIRLSSVRANQKQLFSRYTFESGRQQKNIERLMNMYASNIQFANVTLQKHSKDFFQTIQRNAGDQMLVMRLFEHSCNTCAEQALQDLSSYVDTSLYKNILIVTSYPDNKHIGGIEDKRFRSMNDPILNYANMEGEDLPVHFFLIDKRSRISAFYFYGKEYPELNRKYFELINQRLQ